MLSKTFFRRNTVVFQGKTARFSAKRTAVRVRWQLEEYTLDVVERKPTVLRSDDMNPNCNYTTTGGCSCTQPANTCPPSPPNPCPPPPPPAPCPPACPTSYIPVQPYPPIPPRPPEPTPPRTQSAKEENDCIKNC